MPKTKANPNEEELLDLFNKLSALATYMLKPHVMVEGQAPLSFFDNEGIFRQTGNRDHASEILKALDSGRIIEKSKVGAKMQSHAYVSAIKNLLEGEDHEYRRLLSQDDPLIREFAIKAKEQPLDQELIAKFLNSLQTSGDHKKMLVHDILSIYLVLAAQALKHQEKNKMRMENVAIVFSEFIKKNMLPENDQTPDMSAIIQELITAHLGKSPRLREITAQSPSQLTPPQEISPRTSPRSGSQDSPKSAPDSDSDQFSVKTSKRKFPPILTGNDKKMEPQENPRSERDYSKKEEDKRPKRK